jgi:hypothetical protein
MKSQDMFQNAYGDETFYLTVDEAVNFADTTKYIWKGGTKTILINVALSDATDIRLPEATTDNAGLQVKVVFALAPAENVNIGFVTTNIVGGWVGTSDATEGVAASFVGFSVVGDGYKRAELDKDGEVAKAGGEAGTILEFFYSGVANVAIYRGHLIADVDSATGTTHLVTTTIIA